MNIVSLVFIRGHLTPVLPYWGKLLSLVTKFSKTGVSVVTTPLQTVEVIKSIRSHLPPEVVMQ